MGPPRLSARCSALPLLAVVAALASASAVGAEPPNIVLVILDDVGVELLGAYNRTGAEVAGPTPPEHRVTPNIDALAEAGLVFRNAWSAPFCRPTRAALLTGLFGLHNGSIGSWSYAFDTLPTLPERLAAAPTPYVDRVAIGKWHLTGYVPNTEESDRAPTELGFTAFAGSLHDTNYTGYLWFRDPPTMPGESPPEYRTTKEFAEAVAFVESRAGAPWFLWLATKAAHAPWNEADTPADSSSACNTIADPPRRVRCRQLEIFDQGFGALLAAIEANDPGLANTTVILLGDNGSPAPAPGRPAPIPGKVNRDGKGTLYEGGVNVPLIVAGSAVAANDPRSVEETPALVHVVDVFSTILALAEFGPGAPITDGISFAPVLAGAAGKRQCLWVDGSDVSADWFPLLPANHDVAVRNGRHKLIRRAQQEGLHAYELYDLANDPGETTPLPWSGRAFDDLNAVLERVDADPLASPCSRRKRRYECGLGPELAPLLLGLAVLTARRRARR